MNYATGQIVGDYEVLGALGEGGMAMVYMVRSVISGRVEAMKVLKASSPDQVQRFVRENRVLAQMGEHPNIVSLRASLTMDGDYVMVMEYVDGETLAQRVRRGALPSEEILRYLKQVLTALDFAHRHGIVHRDVKPSNILVTPQGLAKLADFGIGKLLRTPDPALTQVGVAIGSPDYISPEQLLGREVDARSDLYSLGATLYELATGRTPFKGETTSEILMQHLHRSPDPIAELSPDLPPSLARAVMKALEKEPAYRFQSAEEFLTALDDSPAAIKSNAESTRPKDLPVKVRRFPRAFYIAIGALMTVALLLVAAIQVPRWASVRSQSPTPVPSNAVPAPQPATNQVTPPASIPPPGSGSPVPSRRRSQTPRQHSSRPVESSAATAISEVHEFDAANDRLIELRARTAAVEEGLKTLQQDQNGEELRLDIATAQRKLLTYLTQSESDLARKRTSDATASMNAAERELAKIEHMFGR